MRSQNPRPQASTICGAVAGVSVAAAIVTSNVPIRAKMNASGIQRSDQSVSASARRDNTRATVTYRPQVSRELQMIRRVMFGCLVAAGLSAGAAAQPAAAKNDYADAKNWLCRPGRHDACAIDLATTVVAADGKTRREEWKANQNAPIDCFYVYPTVSTDP